MNQPITNLEEVTTIVTEIAEKHGLVFFGSARLDVTQDFQWYRAWLEDGRHAGMEYLTKHLELRAQPSQLLEGAKTAWVFGLPYYLGDKWRRGEGSTAPRFAMYARLKDYHKILWQALDHVFSEIQAKISETAIHTHRVTVDSAPLLERALGANTKGGFIGKNTCLIHPKKGSFFVLGEILTTWDPGVPAAASPVSRHRERTPEGGCGTCRRCQVHCPTGALDKDYQIDARKCLSWWTIENRGVIPKEFWPWIGHYVFGCDICQLVCPWNRGVTIASTTQQYVRLDKDIDLFHVATMDQAAYETLFGGTPATRAKREGLIRNALIAMYVKKHPQLQMALIHAGKEPSPVIAGTIAAIQEELALA